MLIAELVIFLIVCALVVLLVFWEVVGDEVTTRWQQFQEGWRETAAQAAERNRRIEQERMDDEKAAAEAEAELRREKEHRE